MSKLWVTFAAVLLSACQLAPRHERPEPPVAPAYPDEYAGDPTVGTPAPILGWRDFFADPRLKALIGIALERSRDLSIAVAQIEEARGLYRVQRADVLPTIAAGAAATRSRGRDTAFGGRGTTETPGSVVSETIDIYSVDLSVPAFELDFWGRVRNLTAAARAEFLATISAARAFRLSLIREVTFAYLSTLEAQERIAIAESTVRSRTEELRLARRRFEAGVTSELDLRQAETLLTQAEGELAGLRYIRAQSENLLTVLTGGPVDGSLPPSIPLAEQVSEEQLAAGLPSELLASRPDILAAEERLRSARASIGAARAAFFPSIVLTGRYGYASTELEELVGDDGRMWNFGPSIDLPLFDFGRRRANLDVAVARENIAIADYERTIQTAFQEVSDALAGRRYLADQVRAQERGVLAQRRLAALARQRYEEGVVSYLEVLDAERNLFAAEQTLLQLRSAQASNLVTLYVALGGGVLETR